MSADLIGVLYHATSKVVRSITIPELGDGLEDQNILAQQQNPPTGCAVATIARAGLADTKVATVMAAVNAAQKLGLQPPVVSALVDSKGVVQDIVLADPVGSPTHKTFSVIANSVGAGQGDSWDGTNFKRTYALYNKADGKITSVQTVNLPDIPITTASQRLALNNDGILKAGGVVGIQLL